MNEAIIAIFCDIDDFCKEYEKYCINHLLSDKKAVVPKTSMSLSEIMTILIYFHLSNYRTFKKYYINYVCVYLKKYFPKTLSCNRFAEVMQMTIAPLMTFADCEKSLQMSFFRMGRGIRILKNVRAKDRRPPSRKFSQN